MSIMAFLSASNLCSLQMISTFVNFGDPSSKVGTFFTGTASATGVSPLTATALFLRGHAKTYRLFDNEERQSHHDCRPGEYGDDAERLYAEQSEITRVEQTFKSGGSGRVCKKTYRNSAPYAVCEVYAYRADRVVYVKLKIKEFNYEYNKQTGNYTDYA